MFSETPQRNFDFEFFGDFMLDGAARLDDLAMFYSLDLADCGDALTLADFIAKKLGGKPVVGDTLQWSGMGWTVAELDGEQIRRVGVKAQGEAED
jgi:cell volume regulation protein A